LRYQSERPFAWKWNAGVSDPKLRLHSLDALRGVAALSVVLWHWQHLNLLGTTNLIWSASLLTDHTQEPFYPILRIFYERGAAAVDMFFLISGFIFFWLYQDNIANKRLNTADFAALRFSRLYPLHFVCLFIVLIMQKCVFQNLGQYFIYSNNDLKHFLMSIFFIQSGGSFNGPEWSITIELIMYILFCGLSRSRLLQNSWIPLLMFAIGILMFTFQTNLARGLCGFFLGGSIYQLFTTIRGSPHARHFMAPILVVAGVGWGLIIFDTYSSGDVVGAFSRFAPTAGRTLASYAVLYGVFPVTILGVALHEDLFGARYGALAWLGELSYSSYLLHFPLQLAFALLVVTGLLQAEAVRSGAALLIYFAVLIPISLLTFRVFEVPAQKALRAHWLSWRGPARVALTPNRTPGE
jgi:peptidoglycan/LPS O-acetylase OafA/YrhL